MPKIANHIVLNWKVYIRLLLILILPTIIYFRYWDTYILTLFFIIFLMLIFELFKQNYPKNQLEAISYYLLWTTVFFIFLLDNKIRFNYFDYENNSPFFHYPIKKILIVKLTVLIISLVRYKSILVTSTFLSKLFLIVMFSHFAVLFTNSTYSFGISAYYIAIISAVETTLIIFVKEKLVPYKFSIFDFIWKRSD